MRTVMIVVPVSMTNCQIAAELDQQRIRASAAIAIVPHLYQNEGAFEP
jgi:hypothetical protein